jgi:putative hemolysin
MADGSLIFDAALNVRDLQAQYNIPLPDDPSYETVGGFVLNRLGFIPRGGESFEAEGYRFTVMEMDHRRISRVKIKLVRLAPSHVPAEAPAPGDAAKAGAKAAKPRARRRKSKPAANITEEAGAEAPAETGHQTGREK